MNTLVPRSLWPYLWYLSGMLYGWNSLSGIAQRSLGRLSEEERAFIPTSERGTVIWGARLHGLLYLALALAMALGWTAPLHDWLQPLLLGQPVMRFIRMTERVGRPKALNLLQKTRSTQVGWAWRSIRRSA
ncbi:MAG: hypothetical protein RIS90_2508 [Pseudomonadota bacterium]